MTGVRVVGGSMIGTKVGQPDRNIRLARDAPPDETGEHAMPSMTHRPPAVSDSP